MKFQLMWNPEYYYRIHNNFKTQFIDNALFMQLNIVRYNFIRMVNVRGTEAGYVTMIIQICGFVS